MKSLKKDLDSFRVKEHAEKFPYEGFCGIRVTKPMKQRLTKLGMSHGMNESQLCRFLLTAGLAQYGIDAAKAK